MYRKNRIQGWILRASFVLTLPFLLIASFGCSNPNRHTTDSRLQKIDEMLNADLPKGTSKSKVVFYLSSRGFETERGANHDDLVATVSHIDPDTLQPASAQVTFHFDSGNNLVSYDMQ